MAVFQVVPGHSCSDLRFSHPWPRAVIAIVTTTLTIHSMAMGYKTMVAVAAVTAAGFGALAMSRQLAL